MCSCTTFFLHLGPHTLWHACASLPECLDHYARHAVCAQFAAGIKQYSGDSKYATYAYPLLLLLQSDA